MARRAHEWRSSGLAAKAGGMTDLWCGRGRQPQRRAGIGPAFLRKQGLIHSVRTAGNQRRYARAVLRRVAVIKVAQRMGVPLAEIAQALAHLPRNRHRPGLAGLSCIGRHSSMHALPADPAQGSARSCIGCGCLSLQACPLRNDHDCLAGAGAGPHFR
jgi:MerR family redox-sensitive transcriptional activator SoxR